MKSYKYIAAIALLLLLLCSCSANDNVAQTSPSDVTTTQVPSVETAVPVNVVVDGKSEFSILRSIEISGAEQNLYLNFQLEMNERTGCRFKYLECYEGQKTSDAAKEILLGNTPRVESAELLKLITDAGGDRFGIIVRGNKIAISGSGIYQAYCGLDYFMREFIEESEGGVNMTLEDGYTFISDVIANKSFMLDELLVSGKDFSAAMAETVVNVPCTQGYNNMQGGGTDGKHAYAGMIAQNATPEMGRIHKFDLETGELLKVSEPLPTNHTNDMTYDSKNGRIVVVSGAELSFVDPDTMECTGTVASPIGYARAIEYLPSTDEYILVSGQTFARLNGAFEVISSFVGSDAIYVSQGICCDEKYIYDVRYADGGLVHAIVVYDMSGNHIGTGKLFGATGEPENMFFYRGGYYIGSSRSSDFRRIDFMPDKWW